MTLQAYNKNRRVVDVPIKYYQKLDGRIIDEVQLSGKLKSIQEIDDLIMCLKVAKYCFMAGTPIPDK